MELDILKPSYSEEVKPLEEKCFVLDNINIMLISQTLLVRIIHWIAFRLSFHLFILKLKGVTGIKLQLIRYMYNLSFQAEIYKKRGKEYTSGTPGTVILLA